MARGLIWTYMQHREQHKEHHNVLIRVKDILVLHLGRPYTLKFMAST